MKKSMRKTHPILMLCLSLFVNLLLANMAWAKPLVLEGMRVAEGTDSERVVLSFNGPVRYKTFALSNPHRFVVDLNDTQLENPLPKVNLDHLPLKQIRSAVRHQHDLRLVFDLKQAVTPRVFSLEPQEHYAHRLVLDFPLSENQSKTMKTTAVKPKITIPHRAELRDVVVVIDPGHGGKDPGATGSRGTHEKSVVLAISKQLQRLINQQKGMKAVLTRKGDYYISLRQRLNLARQANADIFIAIHADAFLKPSSHGASVFALSARGASSEAARWLAARENNSELGGVDDFSDKSYVVRSVLLDLSQTSTIQASLQLAGDMLKNLGKLTSLHSRKIEQARFVVLKSPDIPSVLVETGFISNPREELNLASSRYQRRLATALLKGIKNYFWQHAPDGTLIEAERKAKRYTVTGGDSLLYLAKRFKVSVAQLKKMNRLTSHALNIGQVLWIPHKS